MAAKRRSQPTTCFQYMGSSLVPRLARRGPVAPRQERDVSRQSASPPSRKAGSRLLRFYLKKHPQLLALLSNNLSPTPMVTANERRQDDDPPIRTQPGIRSRKPVSRIAMPWVPLPILERAVLRARVAHRMPALACQQGRPSPFATSGRNAARRERRAAKGDGESSVNRDNRRRDCGPTPITTLPMAVHTTTQRCHGPKSPLGAVGSHMPDRPAGPWAETCRGLRSATRSTSASRSVMSLRLAGLTVVASGSPLAEQTDGSSSPCGCDRRMIVRSFRPPLARTCHFRRLPLTSRRLASVV